MFQKKRPSLKSNFFRFVLADHNDSIKLYVEKKLIFINKQKKCGFIFTNRKIYHL